MSKFKWKDARLHKPNCNSFNMYPVIFKLTDRIASVGISGWMPKNNYTDGDWINVCFTNGNTQESCDVLGRLSRHARRY